VFNYNRYKYVYSVFLIRAIPRAVGKEREKKKKREREREREKISRDEDISLQPAFAVMREQTRGVGRCYFVADSASPLYPQTRSRASYQAHRPDEVRSLGGLIKKRDFCNSNAATIATADTAIATTAIVINARLVNEVRRSSPAHENDSCCLRYLLRRCK